MAETLKQDESAPDAYPDAPEDLSTAAAALDSDMIWQRIEAYVAHRWTAREVVWTVEGPGEWVPPLTPATITTQEIWDGVAWITASLDASPLGGVLLSGEGPYRLTGTAGGGDVPAAVSEAFRRLAEYSAEIGKDGMLPGHGAVTSHSVDLGGLTESFDRQSTWAARAIINSGAADLLRPYRRA